MDLLAKESQKVGIAADDLARIKYAADVSGVSAEALDKAIGKLSSSMATLSTGTDETSKLLRAIGVTSGDSPLAALEKIADHFAAIPDGVEKTAEAIKLFGDKMGLQLVPMLNLGGKALGDLAGEADKLGLVLSGAVLEQAGKFTDNLVRIQKASEATWMQITAGMLPAISALAEVMVSVTSSGDEWKTFGEGVGEVLLLVAKGVTSVVTVLREMGTDIAAVAAMVANPTQAGTIWTEWEADLQRIDAQEKTTYANLDSAFAKAKQNMDATSESTKKASSSLEDYLKQIAELEAKQKADEEARRAREKQAADDRARFDATQKAAAAALVQIRDAEVKANLERDQSATAAARANDKLGTTYEEVTKEIDRQIEAQQKSDLVMQAMIKLAQDGTEEQQKLAGAWLATSLQIQKAAPEQKMTDTMKALNSGWDRFVDSLAQGSVTVAQAFKGMVESIIADLLKIWAKKYILDAFQEFFGGAAGGGSTPAGKHALGAVFDAGALIPFARGGVINRAVTLPMALMGEAGPEAVMPLKRGADGALGVAAVGGAAGAINVAIHNYTDAQVSARRDGSGDLQVIVEATRKAIASDFRRGGTDVARAAEAAYRLSRGAAAPF
jgi:hypothetical protein